MRTLGPTLEDEDRQRVGQPMSFEIGLTTDLCKVKGRQIIVVLDKESTSCVVGDFDFVATGCIFPDLVSNLTWKAKKW